MSKTNKPVCFCFLGLSCPPRSCPHRPTAEEVLTSITAAGAQDVEVAITAWNGPPSQAAWTIGPAPATGNTLNPATQSPLAALRPGEVLRSSDLPAGIVNGITGDGRITGEAIINHPGLANDTDHVLASTVWTSGPGRATA